MINRLMNCLYPKEIINPYNGEKCVVRCGKCVVCRNSHSALWVQRLTQECQQHRYVFFSTLQFDDQHVPQMVRCDDGISYLDSDTGEIISLLDVHPFGEIDAEKERRFCADTKVLNVLSKRVFQLFIKRLRKAFYKLDHAKLRYWITGEYGPQTFRPHGHILLFFESALCAQNIEQLLVESWQNGTVFKTVPVDARACEYVASYVNSHSDLPQILQHAAIRQFALFSKCPIIGCYRQGLQPLPELFAQATNEMRLYDSRLGKFIDVPIWRTLRCRLFPRLPRYGLLDASTRRILYTEIYRYYVGEVPLPRTSVVDNLQQSFRNGFIPDGIFRRYLETILYRRPSKVTGLTCFSIAPLVRYVNVCYLVYKNATDLGVSIIDYINQIEKFYELCEKSQLNDYFRFQESYFNNHPARECLLFDASFVRRVSGKYESELSSSDVFYLKLYGYSLNPVNISFEDSFDFRNMLSLHLKIYSDTSKSKKSNDYLIANKDKFGNVVTYKNI